MPRGDKTGPMGQGANTGRGLGNCVGQETSGLTDLAYGRGKRGWGRFFSVKETV